MRRPTLQGHTQCPFRAGLRKPPVNAALGLVARIVRKLAVIVAAVLLAGGALLYMDHSENPQREYAALSEEVFAGGWVPRVLPSDATNIKVQTNLDTNEVWVRFRIGTGQYKPETFGFRAVEPSQWPVEPRAPRYNSWWFDALSDFTTGSARLYVGRCIGPEVGRLTQQGRLLIASGEAFLWCASA